MAFSVFVTLSSAVRDTAMKGAIVRSALGSLLNITSPTQTIKINGPNPPPHTAQLSLGSPNVDLTPADKSLLKEGDYEQ
jgi:hypothetical protein